MFTTIINININTYKNFNHLFLGKGRGRERYDEEGPPLLFPSFSWMEKEGEREVRGRHFPYVSFLTLKWKESETVVRRRHTSYSLPLRTEGGERTPPSPSRFFLSKRKEGESRVRRKPTSFPFSVPWKRRNRGGRPSPYFFFLPFLGRKRKQRGMYEESSSLLSPPFPWKDRRERDGKAHTLLIPPWEEGLPHLSSSFSSQEIGRRE